MAEENKLGDNGKIEAQKPAEEIKELRLLILRDISTGRLDVQGPGNGQMYDKWVCFGLMEDAKDFIKAHNANVVQARIVKSNPSMAQQVRNMFMHR